MGLAITFVSFFDHAKEIGVGKSCEIAMAHRRSFPGFQMMELRGIANPAPAQSILIT